MWFFREKPPKYCYGVTGTNGKSSTVYFLHQFWKHQRVPNCIFAGGATSSWPDPELALRLKTEPGTRKEKLRAMRKGGIRHVAKEVYSIELSKNRRFLGGVRWSGAAFLNLSYDHLEMHGTIEDYFEAKKLLFTEWIEENTPTVIGADCPYGRRLIPLRKDPILFGTDRSYPLRFDDESLWIYDRSFPRAELGFPAVDIYVSNLLCAVGLALIDGISTEDVIAALPGLSLPSGRLEEVVVLSHERPVYVDYAQNCGSITGTLTHLRSTTDARVIYVGSWKTRRRDFVEIHAALNELADLCVITNDVEPNDELAELHGPLRHALIVADRRDAIARAISESGPGDVIMINGGHHEYPDRLTGVAMTDPQLIRDVVGDPADTGAG